MRFAVTVRFTDEYTFARDGAFKTHNEYVLANVNPHAAYTHEHKRRFPVNVCAGIIIDNLIRQNLLPKILEGGKYLTFLQVVQPEVLEDVSAYVVTKR